MGSFYCRCGEVIRTSGPIPNPNQWNILPDEEALAFSSLLRRGVSRPDDSDSLYSAGRIVFRCPRSDHLWIFWDGYDGPVSVYENVTDRLEGDIPVIAS